MTDLIQVQLPRDIVEDLERYHNAQGKFKIKAAAATETNAPKTKRNAAAVAKWRDEATQHEIVADQCFYALREQPEVTDHAAD